jgi:hypothetical protein
MEQPAEIPVTLDAVLNLPAVEVPQPPAPSCSRPAGVWEACGGRGSCPASVQKAGKCADAVWEVRFCCPCVAELCIRWHACMVYFAVEECAANSE